MNLFLDSASGSNGGVADLRFAISLRPPTSKRGFVSHLAGSFLQLIARRRRGGSSAGMDGSDHVVLGLGERFTGGGLRGG